MDNQYPRNQIKDLRIQLRLFQVATILLLLIITAAAFNFFIARYPSDDDSAPAGKGIPFYEEVKKIIDPLRYSGMPIIVSPEVRISLNFAAKTWTLHNIHRFSGDGSVILSEGRYGLCGDLAAYVHDRIKPIFGERYVIRFVRVAESGYFLDPRASHIALLITKKSLFGSGSYFLDPSFYKYGKEGDFDEYLFFEIMDKLHFVENKNPDQSFPVGAFAPIFIKKDYLIGLIIDERDSRFDKDNFVIGITATRRFKYSGRYIFAIRRIDGQTEVLEDRYLGSKLLGQDTYNSLCEKVKQLYSGLG